MQPSKLRRLYIERTDKNAGGETGYRQTKITEYTKTSGCANVREFQSPARQRLVMAGSRDMVW